MLKLAGETASDVEKFESLLYSPGLQDTGDKEAATHTIVPTSRPAIGAAQYSHALTLAKPADGRLAVTRLGGRLAVTIDNLGTATHVYCAVRVDVDDTEHELFNEDWTSTGAKLDVVDLHAGNKAILFNLLRDGAAHTFYFLFWADAASQAVISMVELWEAVGITSSAAWGAEILTVTHTGELQFAGALGRVGTGNFEFSIMSPVGTGADEYRVYASAAGSTFKLHPVGRRFSYGSSAVRPTNLAVATDLAYLVSLGLVLRSVQ